MYDDGLKYVMCMQGDICFKVPTYTWLALALC